MIINPQFFPFATDNWSSILSDVYAPEVAPSTDTANLFYIDLAAITDTHPLEALYDTYKFDPRESSKFTMVYTSLTIGTF